MSGGTITAEGLVDLDRYPVLDLEAPEAAPVLAGARTQLAATGAAELPGFVTAEALDLLLVDAEQLAPSAYWSEGNGPAYLSKQPDDLAEGDPRRWRGRYRTGVVAYDQFPEASPLRLLYEWEPFTGFVGAILERGQIYPYADPLGALNLAVMGEGDELQWHFDQTDFVVSLALRSSEAGGDFEVAPRIRDAEHDHFDAVAAVLAGDDTAVVKLPMRPGTLLVFEGRHSLHRVTPVAGEVDRLVGLLGYDTKPGTVSGEQLKLSRYGRTA